MLRFSCGIDRRKKNARKDKQKQNVMVSQGWGENGQSMIKTDFATGEISVVMTNKDPGADQAESGVEQLTQVGSR